MKDMEGHKITLAKKPNPNILMLGQSGQGKTYCTCRHMETAYEKGQAVLCIDFSNSYTRKELEKAHFKYVQNTRVFDSKAERWSWVSNYANSAEFCGNLSDSLCTVLNIESYFQRKWLRKAITKHVEVHKEWSIPEFVVTLEHMYAIEKENAEMRDDIDNIGRLLSRFARLSEITEFSVKNKPQRKWKHPSITIIQLSDYAESEREFMTNLLLTLLWSEIMNNGETVRCDILVLDEMQHLSLKKGSVLSCALRECRRFGLRLVLSTQFIRGYDAMSKGAILQVGNTLIFKPQKDDMGSVAKLISADNWQLWQRKLETLQIGEAILLGNYYVDGGEKIVCTPIICKI